MAFFVACLFLVSDISLAQPDMRRSTLQAMSSFQNPMGELYNPVQLDSQKQYICRMISKSLAESNVLPHAVQVNTALINTHAPLLNILGVDYVHISDKKNVIVTMEYAAGERRGERCSMTFAPDELGKILNEPGSLKIEDTAFRGRSSVGESNKGIDLQLFASDKKKDDANRINMGYVEEIRKGSLELSRDPGAMDRRINHTEEFPPSGKLSDSYIAAFRYLQDIIAEESDPKKFVRQADEIYKKMMAYYDFNKEGWGATALWWVASTFHRMVLRSYLDGLYAKIEKVRTDEECVELAAEVFFTVVKTQGKPNGNSRFGSLLANYVLMKKGLRPFILSGNNYKEYFGVLYDIEYNSLFIQEKENIQKRIREIFYGAQEGIGTGGGLIGRYYVNPNERIEVQEQKDRERYVLIFFAYDILSGDMKKIELLAEKAPEGLFKDYLKDGLDSEMQKKLASREKKVPVDRRFVLLPNRYGISGIGTTDFLAISKELQDDDLAKFHEVAHGAGINIAAYIKGGERAIEEYMGQKLHRWAVGMWEHYALRLLQGQKWPEKDEKLSRKIKLMEKKGLFFEMLIDMPEPSVPGGDVSKDYKEKVEALQEKLFSMFGRQISEDPRYKCLQYVALLPEAVVDMLCSRVKEWEQVLSEKTTAKKAQQKKASTKKTRSKVASLTKTALEKTLGDLKGIVKEHLYNVGEDGEGEKGFPRIGKQAEVIGVDPAARTAVVRDVRGEIYTLDLVPGIMNIEGLLGLINKLYIEEEHRKILHDVVGRFEKSPPVQFFTFKKEIEDLFGFASPDKDIIALHETFVGDKDTPDVLKQWALLHEILEYDINKNGPESKIRKYMPFGKDQKAREFIARKIEDPKVRKDPDKYLMHYFIRALTYELSPKLDNAFTARVKHEKLKRWVKGVDEKYTNVAEFFGQDASEARHTIEKALYGYVLGRLAMTQGEKPFHDLYLLDQLDTEQGLVSAKRHAGELKFATFSDRKTVDEAKTLICKTLDSVDMALASFRDVEAFRDVVKDFREKTELIPVLSRVKRSGPPRNGRQARKNEERSFRMLKENIALSAMLKNHSAWDSLVNIYYEFGNGMGGAVVGIKRLDRVVGDVRETDVLLKKISPPSYPVKRYKITSVEQKHAVARQIINRLKNCVEDVAKPIDVVIDLSLINGDDLEKNMETLALLILSCAKYKNMNFVFEVPKAVEDMETGLKKDINNMPKARVLEAIELLKGKSGEFGLIQKYARGVEFDLARIKDTRTPGEEHPIEILITSEAWLRWARDKNILDISQYPVAMEGFATEGGKVSVRDFESAFAFALLKIYAVALRDAGKKMPKDFINKLNYFYNVIFSDRDHKPFDAKVIEAMVDGEDIMQRISNALCLAIPPMGDVAASEVKKLHENIRLLLEFA